MATAYVTVDDDGRLTPDSVVTVEFTADYAMEFPVPERSEVGGVLFWHRVAAALAHIGWRPTNINRYRFDGGGRIHFDIEEIDHDW